MNLIQLILISKNILKNIATIFILIEKKQLSNFRIPSNIINLFLMKKILLIMQIIIMLTKKVGAILMMHINYYVLLALYIISLKSNVKEITKKIKMNCLYSLYHK